MRKILIVDGLNRSGLAVARALRIAGEYKIFVTSPSRGPRNPLLRQLRSNSVDDLLFTFNACSSDSFIEEIKGLAAGNRIDAIIPIGQAAAVSVSKAKPVLSEICKVLIEDYDNLLKFHDKSRTVSLLEKLRIPHPKTFVPDGESSLQTFASTIEYPVVIKARKGMGGTGIWYARNRDDLARLYQERIGGCNPGDDNFVTDSSNPIIQEYIPGELQDALVFCVNGKVKAGLTQKRVITRPMEGGIGVVNTTTRDVKLLEYAASLAADTGWNGVMMLDFKIDRRTGEPRLLEVNPRFWGTTWLSILAGMNFPHFLVAHAFSETVEYPEEYEDGLTCRWIMDEFAGIFDSPESLPELLRRMRRFLGRFKTRNCRYDLLLSDIKPFFAEMVNFRYPSIRKNQGRTAS